MATLTTMGRQTGFSTSATPDVRYTGPVANDLRIPDDAEPSMEEASAGLRAVDELLSSKKLIFVTGKGGVGKSGVSAALALRARALGLTPLLFECDAPSRPSLFPGGKQVTTKVEEVVPGVFAVNQDSEDAVHQYALAALPSKALADLLFENRVARLFLQASPSVNEMALIGRIVQLIDEHEHEGPIIVDLHATGHALAMLKAPDGILRVLRAGPVFERAQKVRDVIFDEERCAVVTVALPEELPVTELLEFLDALTEINAPLGPVFANGVFPEPAPDVTDEILDAVAASDSRASKAAADANALRAWARRSARERDRLADGMRERGLPVISLPYVCDLSPSETLAGRIADVFEARAEAGDA